MQDIEYYYNKEGKIGVLVSGGFGTGWSTANDYGIKLALDKRVIEKFLEHEDDNDWLEAVSAYKENPIQQEFLKFLDSLGYSDYINPFGFQNCHLEYVEKGLPIRIEEYDGRESLEVGYQGYTILG